MLATADLSCSILPRAADNDDANCSFSASCFLAYIRVYVSQPTTCAWVTAYRRVHVSHFARPSLCLTLYPFPCACPSLSACLSIPLSMFLFLCVCQSLHSSSPYSTVSICTFIAMYSQR